MNEKELMFVKGNDGRLIIFDSYVYFERKSFLGHFTRAFEKADKTYLNEKKIPYEMINGIEWNKASKWRNGYLTLAVEGEIKIESGLAGAAKNATSIVFFPKANDDAEKCAEFIANKIKENKKTKIEITTNSNVNQTDD